MTETPTTPTTTCKFCWSTVTFAQASGPFPGGWVTDDGWGTLCMEAPDNRHAAPEAVHRAFGVGTTYDVWYEADGFLVTVSSGGSHLKPCADLPTFDAAVLYVSETVRAEVLMEMGQ